jgi:predicted nucleotidyltransferase
MTLDEIKAVLRKQQPVLTERFKGNVVGIFGSRARGDHRPDSDLDLLVEFEKGADFFDLIHIEEYLEELLGVRVEVCSVRGLRPSRRELIDADLVSL